MTNPLETLAEYHNVSLPRTQYRNVTVDADGTIHGERTLGRPDSWIGFRASPKLLRISEAIARYPDLDDRIWSLQDGYGEPGFTPVQGWDWSGIRDSTPQAIDRMWSVACSRLSDAEFCAILGLPSLKTI